MLKKILFLITVCSFSLIFFLIFTSPVYGQLTCPGGCSGGKCCWPDVSIDLYDCKLNTDPNPDVCQSNNTGNVTRACSPSPCETNANVCSSNDTSKCGATSTNSHGVPTVCGGPSTCSPTS